MLDPATLGADGDAAPPPATAVVRRAPVHPDRSAILRGRSAGPLRLLFPRTSGRAAWIVTSSLGGGLVDGDRSRLEVDVGAWVPRKLDAIRAHESQMGAAHPLSDLAEPDAVRWLGREFFRRLDLPSRATTVLEDLCTRNC